MSNKFNANALTEYSKSYARRIAADVYQHRSAITGQQILTLTPINQINLFVISSLSDKWRADAEKFRSAYFDYTNPEVQEALQNFMNVVSQHISVRREHLEPLLAEATRRAIILVFDPRAYFDDILRDQPEFTLTSDVLKQVSRYTKINQFIPLHIAQRMSGKPFIYVNQALSYLDEVLTQRTHELEHYDDFVAKLSEKLPMDVAALLRSHVPDVIPNSPSRSFFDAAVEPITPPAPLVPADAVPNDVMPATPPQLDPVPAGITADESGSGGPMFLRGNESGPEPVAPVAQPSQLQTGSLSQPSVTTNAESESGYVPTLNDTLRESASAEPVSVAQSFSRKPIESVGRSISLNQKFRFINQLFNGNSSAYNQAVAEIDTLDNYGQALDLISYRYASQYLWDMSSDEVSELVEILKRRFV
ncbi:hypothetical protein [Spirosoma utsteinense]|uniref:Uncharacterized protein n=1 Tax=Spirosoma utsteinense TaxID=2585773 RepID=A0ABR6W100_9BACT|nr:hypothetical protein [Spirosoma utsteinense]MBC3783745.1 hypothetical protein [Spirosoma utsteinense]MBC3790112.1 hypothetical protein [Spirosoma utsteinense]